MTQEHVDYLNALRDSGVTNMFGAAPYLKEVFELSSNEARQVLTEWMLSFDDSEESKR